MDAILDAGFPSRFRFYRIPIKHRAPIVFPLISIPNWSDEGRGSPEPSLS